MNGTDPNFHGHWRPLRAISIALCPSCVDYEEQFSSKDLMDYTIEHTEIPIFACCIYLCMIFYLPAHLGDQPLAKGLIRKAWGIWNLGLSVFSIFGASRTVPVIWHHLVTRPNSDGSGGYLFTVCGGQYYPDKGYSAGSEWYTEGPAGLWVGLFIYSKIPELVDTAFLVIQKKPVIFLHWFHHVTVLLYCWHSYHHKVSSGLWFATMNYCVHSIMYFYYAIMIFPSPKALKNIAQAFAPLITTIQISQMVGGIIITCTGAYYTMHTDKCHINSANYKLGLAMYASYCVLFITLFCDKFIKPKPTRSSGGKRLLEESKGAVCNAAVSDDAAGFFHGQSPRARASRSGTARSSGQKGGGRRSRTPPRKKEQ